MSYTLQGVVSVVIRVRNAAAEIEESLSSICQQILPTDLKLELIVVDNDSTDGSARVARKYGAKVVAISQKEFTWGRALNRGIENTTGDIVVLLSADAQPVDRWWLIEMLKPFSDPVIAAVYGKQLSRSNAPVDERIRIAKKFGTESILVDAKNYEQTSSGRGMPVSNVCAAIRKDVWQKIGYDETIEGGEDGLWTCNILKAGHSYLYQANAVVIHSHNDKVFRFAWREFEIAQKNLALEGKSMGPIQLVRFVGSFAKRRLRNCVHSNIPARIRIKGFVRMPWEMIAFCIVFITERLGFGHDARSLMWG